jgi:hypothetical protein
MAIKYPYVGQKVRLNDIGIDTFFLNGNIPIFIKTAIKQKIMHFTKVENIPMNAGEETSIVEVDDIEINEHFLTSFMFDEVV